MEQNLISAELSAEQFTAILEEFTHLREAMPFLIAMDASQRKRIAKMGDVYKPFVELAIGVVKEHPNIISPLFDSQEFLRDFKLYQNLSEIFEKAVALTEALDNTILAAGSDSFKESLQVYAAVIANKDKVPGLEDIAARMSAFFEKKKSGKKDTPPPPTPPVQ